MSRNKYPEQTVERILDAAQRLFLEKGYEATTIQDIVDELGGLTKGAIYHHFKSMADIMNALGDRMFLESDPFRAVEGRKDLNGLEKMREVVRLHQADAEQQLKSLGVSVLVTQAVDTSVASGAVIRTDPAAGTQVESGSTVVVYVSRPQVATTTKVPSLSGMSVDDARTLLVQNHLGLGSQTDQYSDQPVGTVIGQNPAAGSTAKLNGRVNITVSAGPEPAPVEPEAPSGSGSDWWGSLWGGDSSSSSGSSSSTETGESASSSEGSGLADWWTSLLG